jgi:tetratricopeptide (TPR) repeat protein
VINLEPQLAQLESAQLVRRLTEDDLAYLFKHALVQDTAYESLLKHDRKRLHRAVAETLERAYSTRLDEFAARLAQHYAEAGDDAKTLEYATRAGDVAARVYANDEALIYFDQAIRLAARDEAGSARLIQLYTRRGRILELMGKHEQALENYDEMEALAHERGDRGLELAALIARATIHSTPTAKFDPPLAQALSERALDLARAMSNRQAEAKILWNLMLLHFFMGRIQESLVYGEQAIVIAREFHLREQLAFILNDIARSYLIGGEVDRGMMALLEARTLWQELGNQPMLADNLSGSSFIYLAKGDYDQLLSVGQEAYRLTESIGNPWGQSYSLLNIGFVYLQRGEITKAIETMEECLRLGEQAGFLIAIVNMHAQLGLTYALFGAVERGYEFARLAYSESPPVGTASAAGLGTLALIHLLQGELEQARAAVAQSYALTQKGETNPFAESNTMHADVEIALAERDYARALNIADNLLSMLMRFRWRPFRADGLYARARALLGLGRIEEARQALLEARMEAEALGARGVLWEILALWSDLEAQYGDATKARQAHTQARDIVEYIAAHSPPDLRASFLNLPAVLHVTRDR